jgi:hypothetical protein
MEDEYRAVVEFCRTVQGAETSIDFVWRFYQIFTKTGLDLAEEDFVSIAIARLNSDSQDRVVDIHTWLELTEILERREEGTPEKQELVVSVIGTERQVSKFSRDRRSIKKPKRNKVLCRYCHSKNHRIWKCQKKALDKELEAYSQQTREKLKVSTQTSNTNTVSVPEENNTADTEDEFDLLSLEIELERTRIS